MKKILCAVLGVCMLFGVSVRKREEKKASYVVESVEISANKPSVERVIFVIDSSYYYHNNKAFSDGASYVDGSDIYVLAKNLGGRLGIEFDETANVLKYEEKAVEAGEDGCVSLKATADGFGMSYGFDDIQKTAYISKRSCLDNEFDMELANDAKATILKKVKLMDENCRDNFPEGSVNGVYEPNNSPGWVGGFYSGINYLCAAWSEDEIYSEIANKTRVKLEKMIEQNPQVFAHDIGFTSYLSSYKEYLRSGSDESKAAVIAAADALMDRVKENGKYIQAWPSYGGKMTINDTRMIADTMCNLPLLFAATELSGDEKYKEAATTHAKLNQKYIIRKDATIAHTFIFNESGDGGVWKNSQGAHDDSCWSRGMSWVILGMSMAYDATGDETFLESARLLTDTYILRSEEDLIPRWDYVYQNIESEPLDTSAAAIAACGMFNIYKSTGDKFYKNTAYYIFENLYTNYSSKNDEASSGILYHATGNIPGKKNIDVCLIYGDYYFTELTSKLLSEEK